jgi:hypothetical protein
MARKKKTTLYVIFHGPQHGGGRGTRYITKDGTTTEHKSHAATFGTVHDAITFAKEKGIIFDGKKRYLGREEFTDEELQGH